MTMYAVERPVCETAHQRPVWAVTWSWLFGAWLCHDCLNMRSAAEAQRIPGGRLDRDERRKRRNGSA